MWKLATIVAAVLAACAVAAGPVCAQGTPALDPVQHVFARLYDYDFAGAQALLDAQVQAEPGNPLLYSTRAVAYLFTELDRLKILEIDFFLNDGNMVDGHGRNLKPDAGIRRKLFEALDQARAKAAARLAESPDDRDALFAMCMTSGVTADYTGLVERRQWKGLTMSRETNTYAEKLLALKPPFYDAYYTVGALEYVVGSLPFFIRWFVHFDRIDGDRRKGIEALKLVARNGRYLRSVRPDHAGGGVAARGKAGRRPHAAGATLRRVSGEHADEA